MSLRNENKNTQTQLPHKVMPEIRVFEHVSNCIEWNFVDRTMWGKENKARKKNMRKKKHELEKSQAIKDLAIIIVNFASQCNGMKTTIQCLAIKSIKRRFSSIQTQNGMKIYR